MTDREKVIKGLREMSCRATWKDIDRIRHRFQPIINDAIVLLKEQETVKSTADDTEGIEPYAQGDGSWACNNCGETVGWEEMNCGGISLVKHKYCPECGQAVKWE